MILSDLFNTAAKAAQEFNGSEASFKVFMDAAIQFDNAAKDPSKTDELLNAAIRAVEQVNSEESFLDKLARGGAKIFRHGAVFVRPDPEQGGIESGEGQKTFEGAVQEPRLREVVMALQTRQIYFDDLVIDVGAVRANQMREYPYAVITIPRLNAQIVVADQKGEAIFAVKPSIPFMNWALFEKKMVRQEGTAFENVRRYVHAGDWREKLLAQVCGEDTGAVPPKVMLDGYVKAHRKSKYPLTEEMVVAMARLVRERDPDKQWPSQQSGVIPHDIVAAVTGDEHWQSETWRAVDAAGRIKIRGLTRTLAQILKAHGCSYYLTEEMVVKMARMVRENDPEKKWPSHNSGTIPHEIVVAVTGDEDWQAETWGAVGQAGLKKNRRLTRTLSQMLDAHCPERGKAGAAPAAGTRKPEPM